jgi:hypothetical protein
MSTEPQNQLAVLLQQAMAPDAAPEKLRELLAVRREWENDESRKAYNIAIAEFQKRAPIVEKGDLAYDKPYARIDRIWRTIRPLLADLGLSVTWQVCTLTEEGQLCHVEGMLRHRGGYGEKLIRDIPLPELIKGQNKAQQAGSASTYATRFALCGALGVITGDEVDDDGAGGKQETITNEQAHEVENLLEACRGIRDFNEPKFWEWLCKRQGGAELKRIAEIRASVLPEVTEMLKKKLGKKT